MHEKLYHMGISGKVSRSTLADANENRNWRIYADFSQVFIHKTKKRKLKKRIKFFFFCNSLRNVEHICETHVWAGLSQI